MQNNITGNFLKDDDYEILSSSITKPKSNQLPSDLHLALSGKKTPSHAGSSAPKESLLSTDFKSKLKNMVWLFSQDQDARQSQEFIDKTKEILLSISLR